MSDTERLNLIEHYQWCILRTPNMEWKTVGKFGSTDKFKTIREAIDAGLMAQAKWSLG